MVRKSKSKSLCMVALLIAEATQAVTPDVASLSSTRLFQIVRAVAESGKSRLTPCLHVGCLTIHTEKFLPPNGSAPFEDRRRGKSIRRSLSCLSPTGIPASGQRDRKFS